MKSKQPAVLGTLSVVVGVLMILMESIPIFWNLIMRSVTPDSQWLLFRVMQYFTDRTLAYCGIVLLLAIFGIAKGGKPSRVLIGGLLLNGIALITGLVWKLT
ncbi:MAG: hypothetical protein IT447_09260 [Phycisphaerales bacterium]|nr:hypothetical protein [Phycisphaerales bacterium]